MDDHEDSEKRERVLLRPWLENLIEGGSIPGLEWIDDMKTTFKVPWKHRSKKTWSLRHSSIFLEWAKNTGRWSEGDPEPNYAQLKTRLRCAFNKAPDIEEMKELHRTKSEEPYKVYKFIPRKESKLYPFGRRPLRKTTVPITVRRRRYLISRISSGAGGGGVGRFSISDAIHRVKREKEEITDLNCVELAADRGFGVTGDRKDWPHSTWLTEDERAAQQIGGATSGVSGGAWSMYDHEDDSSQTVNRILPLIVEEENYSCASFDLELTPPAEHGGEHEPRMKRSLMPRQLSRDSSISLPDESTMISIPPKLIRDDSANVGRSFSYQGVLPSPPSLVTEKREMCRTYGDGAQHHHDSTTIYVKSPLVDLQRNDPYDNHRILPHADGFIQDQTTKYHGAAKQHVAGAASFLAPPEQWVHGVAENRQQMKKRSLESGAVQENLDESSEVFHPETVSKRRPSLFPAAARLFPLKNRYIMSQNAFSGNGETSQNHEVVPGQRQNAVVKPSAITQPQIAVATPYDGKPSLEDESPSTVGGIPENVKRDLVKKYIDSYEADGQPTEMEVMDLSTKLSDQTDSESKVLDLTKKMVVTPFERDCHVNSSVTVSKGNVLDIGKETGDDLLSSDPAVLSSTVSEILKFKADYKRKKQLIVTKTMILVEKERELKAREKQLAAREEALFWKENYLHKVMVGTDVGPIPNIATSRNGAAAGPPFSPRFEAALPGGPPFRSNEMKDASSSGVPFPPPHLQQHQSSPIVMATAAAAAGPRSRNQAAAAVTLTRPQLPAFMPYYQMSARPFRPHMSSVTSGPPPASLFNPHGAISVPMNTARLGDVGGDPHLSQKAVGCTVLPPVVKRSVGSSESTDPGLEPEADVALGDASPGRKSYYSTERTESEITMTRGGSAVNEGAPTRSSLMMVRKRGRPKGSKNKIKLARLNAESAALRQMPPLLIIRSPPPSKDSSGLDHHPTRTPTSLPFHHLPRNANLSGIALNAKKYVADPGMQSMESSRDQHPPSGITIGNSYSASRILPPVPSNSSSPHYGAPTPELSTPTTGSHSFFDQLPNREIMPETVRQLLMSASKPVSNILPPLSPPKSPEEFSHEIIPDDAVMNLCNGEKTSADENRTTNNVV